MSTPVSSNVQPQILFWPRWSEPNGLDRLWRVAATLVPQGNFQFVIRHDPEFDGPLEAAYEYLHQSFQQHFGDSVTVYVSLMTGHRDELDWESLRDTVRVVLTFGDEPIEAFGELEVPRAHDAEEILRVLGYNRESSTPSDQFQRNLQAITRRDSNLANRLRNAAPGQHIRRHQGRWEIRFRRHWVAIEEDRPDTPGDDSKPCLVLGIGVGTKVDALLEQGVKVVAWDRDPWMMCVALSQQDWSSAIQSGQLRLVMGPDIVSIPHTYSWEWRHPLLGELYGREIKMWADPNRPVALVVVGELFVDDVADALERQGFGTYMWDTRNLQVDELAYVAKRLRPHFVMSINYQRGLAEGCRGLNLPLLVWEIDPALDHLQSCQTPTDHCHIYTWRRKQLDDWRRAGFRQVHHLPLAANHYRRTPGPVASIESRYRADVSFVGSSLSDTLAYCRHEFIRCWQAWSGRKDIDEPNEIIAYILEFHRQHPSIYAVDEMLSKRCPGLETASQWSTNPNMLVGELVAHQYRRQVVEALAPMGIRVWGDEGWTGVDAGGGRFMGPASHNRDVTQVYRGSLINIDVGRRYQRDIVTMRVFDVLACGGFVLAEDCEDLRACFTPGVHLDSWSTIEELVEKTQWYRSHPEHVERIRRQGHRHLLENHTIDERVAQLMDVVVPAAV